MSLKNPTAARGLITIVLGSSLMAAACSGAPAATGSASSSILPSAASSTNSPSTAATAPSGSGPAPTESAGTPAPSPSEDAATAADYRGSGASRTFMYSVVKCDGPTGGSWNVDIRESSGGGAFTYYEIPEGSDRAPAQIDSEILLGDPDDLKGTGTFVAGDPPHFVIENGEGKTDIELEVGTFCR